MSARQNKRLQVLEQSLGPKEYPHMVFFDSPRFKDEPDDRIIGACVGEQRWMRMENESYSSFSDRVAKDPKNLKQGLAFLIRDDSGLPESRDEFPFNMPYAEAMKRLKEKQQIEGTHS